MVFRGKNPSENPVSPVCLPAANRRTPYATRRDGLGPIRVDRGSHVKDGQEMARVEAPELASDAVSSTAHCSASTHFAKARSNRMVVKSPARWRRGCRSVLPRHSGKMEVGGQSHRARRIGAGACEHVTEIRWSRWCPTRMHADGTPRHGTTLALPTPVYHTVAARQ